MPLKNREQYNAYMRDYKRKRTLLVNGVEMLLEWIRKASTWDSVVLFMYEKDSSVALVPKENMEEFLQKGHKLGIPKNPTKVFTITCEEGK